MLVRGGAPVYRYAYRFGAVGVRPGGLGWRGGPRAPDGARVASVTSLDDPTAAAAHVLAHYVDDTDPNAMEAGRFARELIDAFVAADAGNRLRLGTAFPAYGYVFAALDGHHDRVGPDGVPVPTGDALAAGLARVRRLAAGIRS